MNANNDEKKAERLFVSSAQMAIADNYNSWIFDKFKPQVKGRVLEVGCGVGTFTRSIISKCSFDSLLSIDVSEEAVEFCRGTLKSPALNFMHSDVMDINGSFDCIICMNVLEHIQDDRSALLHLLEILAPNGFIFLLVPAHITLFSDFDRAAGHFRRYSKKAMRSLLLNNLDNKNIELEQYYFNSVGAVGYYFVYKILNKMPKSDTSVEIGFFDTAIVPLLRIVEPKWLPFGLSLISVIRKIS